MSVKIAFVTGGASEIGASLTTKLVDGGAEVRIADRHIGPAQLAQRLNSGGGKGHAIELDVRSYPSFECAVAEAVQKSGRIDYLFNNAGIGIGGEIDSDTLDDSNDVFDVSLHGVVHGIQAVYPIMIRQRLGHIVNTASMAGPVAFRPRPAQTTEAGEAFGLEVLYVRWPARISVRSGHACASPAFPRAYVGFGRRGAPSGQAYPTGLRF